MIPGVGNERIHAFSIEVDGNLKFTFGTAGSQTLEDPWLDGSQVPGDFDEPFQDTEVDVELPLDDATSGIVYSNHTQVVPPPSSQGNSDGLCKNS